MRIGLGLGLTSTLNTGGGVPAGYSRTTYNGDQVSYNGKPVFDNGSNFIARAA